MTYPSLPYYNRVAKHKRIPNIDKSGTNGQDPLATLPPTVLNQHLKYLHERAKERKVDDWISLIDLRLTYEENIAIIREQGLTFDEERVEKYQKMDPDYEPEQQAEGEMVEADAMEW